MSWAGCGPSESINAAGDITGFYEVVAGVPQGFVRYSNGRIVTFDPIEFRLNPPEAQPVSMNDFAVIAGNYPFPCPLPTVLRGRQRESSPVLVLAMGVITRVLLQDSTQVERSSAFIR